MALPGPPEPPPGAPRQAPRLLELGALCLDSDIILGFTSHLLRRRAKVAEASRAREPLPLPEAAPRKRPPAEPECDPRGGRPAPEGAGPGSEQGPAAGAGGWCRHCHTRLAELRRQAWRLVSAAGPPLRDPCLSALLLDKLPACRPEPERRCDACAARLGQLTREALRLLQAPAGREDLGPPAGPGPMAGPDRDGRRAPAWPPGPSVQVSVAPAGRGGALSTVTIRTRQGLEGAWSLAGVGSVLPPSCLAEAAVAAVAVADTVRDCPPALGPDGVARMWGRGGACAAALLTPAPTAGTPTGTSAAASFFLRAAQKLSLASKRKKPPPAPVPAARGTAAYPTDFSGVLRLWPPPAPPGLLRPAPKVKEPPGGPGKVKVMLRIWPAQGAEAASFLKVDPRKKQVTLFDPAAGPPGSVGPPRRAPTAPRMFAFDAVFPQDSEQAEVCSGAVADVLQSVVSGADGCIFCFGHTGLGTAYTMIGKDSSPQSLGVVPCAISWLFRLIEGHRGRSGTRFSVRVSAVEVCGRGAGPRDLLAEAASGSLPGSPAPGVHLREDPACGAQLQNQSELRAPTAEKAALYLDAALAARSPGGSHMLFSLHLYQYRVEKGGQGPVSGGHSRLHLIDLGSCEGTLGPAPGGHLCLSLSALGSVILALVSGAKHVPYRDHRLTALLRESLATGSCRTTMVAHVSDSPACHAETLSTVQLAARIHRLRRRKVKYASSSSGGESSCEEGRARRAPPLRPLHARPLAPDPERRGPGLPGDPDYSSSSEQSCDTVIYVGPGGAPLSDRELSDHEGPPDFVPIVPALSRRRPSAGPRDADHFRCSTFAELQERLECVGGPERPAPAPGPARGARRPSPPPGPALAKAAAGCPRGSPGPSPHRAAPETPAASPGSDQREEPPAPDKDTGPRSRRPLPSPAPPPPPAAGRVLEEPEAAGVDGATRSPPAGCPCPWAGGRRPERGRLTTTVTLQQPVELNGEDELVFTVVEELVVGALPGPGRPASLASFGSDCSLQALASGSRPVSIISSINDEFDACTSQAPGAGAGGARTGGGPGPGTSWPSEVGPTRRPSPDPPAGPEPLAPPALGSAREAGGGRSPEQGGRGPALGPLPAAAAAQGSWGTRACAPRGAAAVQTIHSSLPRRPRTTSSAGRADCAAPGLSPPGPGDAFEDPWLPRAVERGPGRAAPASPAPALAGAWRVVDGCEGAARPGAGPPIPPLRRGATTLGVTTPSAPCVDAPAEAAGGAWASPGGRKAAVPRGAVLPRPGGPAPPAPPVRKSSLQPKDGPAPASPPAAGPTRGEDGAKPSGRPDPSVPRATSSLKVRPAKAEAGSRPTGHGSLERCEGLAHGGGRAREAAGRPVRAVPRLGVPPPSPTPASAPACRPGLAKGTGPPRPPAGVGKGRGPAAGGSRAPVASGKPPPAAAGRSPGSPPAPRAAPRAAAGAGAKAGRGTVMGTKQALRVAHSRVHELAGGAPGRGGPAWASADSDSGNDSGVQVGEERPRGPALPSPYSTVTAPRRPQRCSSGHGSDNSSVLSGELPPAMGRTALFYHSGGSSGYESVPRDSEATGSASSAPDSTSDSGAASPGSRPRSLKSPKKRATGLQRRRLIPTPLPDAAALGRKPSLPGQWVDLPPPLAGSLKEPFEIKVYEIDDVERLQRHRLSPREDPAELSPEVQKGPVCVSAKLRLAERRQQRLREVQARHQHLSSELAQTQGRLMLEPGRWLEQFQVGPELEPESAEYLAALERATAALEQCVNLCKAHVMMVTCFDISLSAPAAPGPQEVDV